MFNKITWVSPSPIWLVYSWEEKKTSGICAYREKAMWGYSKMVAIYKPKTKASGKTKAANSITLDFQPPKLWENTFLYLNHSVCSSKLIYKVLTHFKVPTYFSYIHPSPLLFGWKKNTEKVYVYKMIFELK